MKKTVQLTKSQKIKNHIWHFLYKFFPWLQAHLLKWHLVWHEKGRQQYHIGYLAPKKTLQELEKHLHEKWGFGNHFVAWSDEGQVLSWRKLTDFSHQYHIRVFKEGEIRGHYEYTPEDKPLDHFTEKGETANAEDFKKFLGDYVVHYKHISHLVPDVNTAPESEITVEESLSTASLNQDK